MLQFSPIIIDYWNATMRVGDLRVAEDGFSITVNADLADDRRVMLLKMRDGNVMATLNPAMAAKAGIDGTPPRSETALRRQLAEAAITLHGADRLFYYAADTTSRPQHGTATETLRQLSIQDETAFASFEENASEQDRDDAWVELDHWAVFGAFEQDRLVCAASAYLHKDAPIADIGVLTLMPFRGKGHARSVVRAISAHALAQGYEPQYRCQIDNTASSALARAAGLSLFGTWDVISSDCTA